jgi:hypothetical protein
MTHAVLARSNYNADKKHSTEARKARNNKETTEGGVGMKLKKLQTVKANGS